MFKYRSDPDTKLNRKTEMLTNGAKRYILESKNYKGYLDVLPDSSVTEKDAWDMLDEEYELTYKRSGLCSKP
jgi:hypothetical protein